MLEREYFLGFSVFPGIGPKRFSDLLNIFESAENAWNSDEDELTRVLGKSLCAKFIKFRESFSFSEYLRELQQKNLGFITRADDDYPMRLLDLEDPPFLIYYKGDKKILNQAQNDRIIGIVGTRRITSYGAEITELFTRDLILGGAVSISGLALGVDRLTHVISYENGGKTIAVLGCGVDCCYPSANQEVYQGILRSGGLIISEYPLSLKPSKGSFPARNRIIASLSDGLLVTEGAEDSGSLITAMIALDLGRKVFAVPGPVTSGLSRGPLKLIRKGAILVTSPQEIAEELGLKSYKGNASGEKVKGDTKDEQRIIDLLENEPMHIDEIVRKTGLRIAEIGTLISLMEIKGYVVAHEDKFYLSKKT